jgi:nicotinic acid mononucleotide adenylyltransferase/nicotinamide mononucleotide (NMN) deamidase PncC
MNSKKLVDLIHKTRTRCIVITTGGGTEIFPMLLKRGGGSATLISGMIPYEPEESIALMGGNPEKLASEESCRVLAMVAFQRALKLRKNGEPVIGVATSSILQRTPEEREGRTHYIYAALQTAFQTVSVNMTIPNGRRMIQQMPFGKWTDPTPETIRKIEEQINAEIVLNLIAEGCGLSERVELYRRGAMFFLWCLPTGLEQMVKTERSSLHHTPNGISLNLRSPFTPSSQEAISGLVEGTSLRLGFECNNRMTLLNDVNSWRRPKVIFPGSFNPLHQGHLDMVNTAFDVLGVADVDCEISLKNVDKPNLDLISLERRLKQFTVASNLRGRSHVWVTNAPTFVEKAALFPGATFIVGYDTAKRIHNPKYAGDINEVMAVFEKNDTKFLVFGRISNCIADGFQCTLDGFHETFRKRATLIEEKVFRNDISSTLIRNSQ